MLPLATLGPSGLFNRSSPSVLILIFVFNLSPFSSFLDFSFLFDCESPD